MSAGRELTQGGRRAPLPRSLPAAASGAHDRDDDCRPRLDRRGINRCEHGDECRGDEQRVPPFGGKRQGATRRQGILRYSRHTTPRTTRTLLKTFMLMYIFRLPCSHCAWRRRDKQETLRCSRTGNPRLRRGFSRPPWTILPRSVIIISVRICGGVRERAPVPLGGVCGRKNSVRDCSHCARRAA